MTGNDMVADDFAPNDEYVRWNRADDIVTLTFDDPDRRANTMSARCRAALRAAVDRLASERDSIAGVIITSAKDTFFAGADLAEVAGLRPQDVAGFQDVLDSTKADLRRLETFGRPVVAALNGSAVGGGLEIALACHHRIAIERPESRFGLPEVTLGLLPGAGGVSRVVRRLGVVTGLQEILLDGKLLSAGTARQLGLIEDTVAGHEQLIAAAVAWIRANPAPRQPWDTAGFTIPGAGSSSRETAGVLSGLIASVRERFKDAKLPAPHHILSAAVEGANVDLDTALGIETTYFLDLAMGQIAKNMIQARWFDLNAIKAGRSRPSGHPPAPVSRIAVLGSGMMGSGIACASARSGIEVVLKDSSAAVAELGKERAGRVLSNSVRGGDLSESERNEILARITVTDGYDALAGCELLIEAVPEDQALKHEVLGLAERAVGPRAVLSTNTSTIPITGLATAVSRAADFIGLHFFSPVERMPLVEVIRGERTSDATLARALDYVAQLGKVPIVVNDGRGFFTSRVIGTFINEALGMLGEGISAASIEQAATQAGYPVGALQLADEVSLSLLITIRNEARALAGAGYSPHPADAVLDVLAGAGRLGRTSGGGFYDYDDRGRRAGLWPGLARLFSVAGAAADIDLRELGERMVLVEALEAARCVEDGIITSAADANVGSLLGIGYPTWTGGVLQCIDGHSGGLNGFVARTDELAARHGPRFLPSPWLRDRARSGGGIRAAAGPAAN